MGWKWRCQSSMAASESRGRARQWPAGHKPWPPCGGSILALARPVSPAWAHKHRALVAQSTHPPSPSPSRSVVALEPAAAELVHRLTPFSHALGRVTLGLSNGMMETYLSPSFSQNSVSTAMLSAPPHGHARGRAHRRHPEPSPMPCSSARSPGWSSHPCLSMP